MLGTNMKMLLEKKTESRLELLARKKGVRVVRDSLRELYTLNRGRLFYWIQSQSRRYLTSPTEYLTIIPRARMGSEPIAAEWAIDSEATRARGIIVLVKSN